MKRIPLHSLVIMVGPAGGGKTTLAQKKFAPYEILGSENIRYELTGDRQKTDINNVVFYEIHRRANLKLDMGERVVIDATNLRRGDRMDLAEIGTRLGVPIFYIVCDRSLDEKLMTSLSSWRTTAAQIITKQEQTFKTNERDISRGDGIANVIDSRKEDFEVVTRLGGEDLYTRIKARGYRGLMVIGDIHGMIESLKSATEWASQRGLFAIFLGDILDYGPSSLECVNHVYDIVTRGRGIAIIGNHERKIERWLYQVRFNDVRVRLSEGNKVTTRAIEALTPDDRRKFEVKYHAMLNLARHHWVVANTLFTHGAAEPEMFDILTPRLTGKFETMALFGEVDSTTPQRGDGYPNRVYNWVDRIPSGQRVMVGHDIRSTTMPLHVQGALGGEAYFMDTGSGKGGRLTSADVMFESGRLVVKAFRTH